MYDAASLSDAPALQRARGELRVSVDVRDGRTSLDGLRQAGCLKARFPRSDDWLNVVTVNTSGGIAGGDELDSLFTVGKGACATIAAQAAERFYRALPGTAPSRVRTRVVVAEESAAEWLPQETILFDRCAVDRTLRVEVAHGAWFVGVESLVFGRKAMGEVVEHGSLCDRIQVSRGGRPLLHDVIRMDGKIAETLSRTAVANGARAIATVIHVAPGAEAKVDAVRATMSGASAWDGMLVARILAADGASLRQSVIAVLDVLRGGRALPRVWMC